MKKLFLFIVLVGFSCVAQSINDYKYVIVPVKYDFQKKENQYRLNTLTKHKLNTIGFSAFYDNEQVPADIANNRCDKLYVNVEKQSAFLSVKLIVTFKDCQNNIVYKSKPGSSKLKEFEPAFHEALSEAFESIIAQNYSYNGKNFVTATEPKVESKTAVVPIAEKETIAAPVNVSGTLKAEATASGYLLIDEASSKIVLKLQKTSDPKIFMANQQSKQGMVISKDNQWFFEYYENNKLISEKLNVTF